MAGDDRDDAASEDAVQDAPPRVRSAAPARAPAYLRQPGHAVRCEWGAEGVLALAPEADVVVIVDVLSFTTCVDIAVSRGAVVLPYRWRDASAEAYARERGALLVGKNPLGLTLRPASLESIEAGCRLVLPSPNGSTLARLASGRPTLAGCLRNATAVAARAREFGERVAVVPAGERWPGDTLRPSLEDWIGAGAIIAALPANTRSPEAAAAVAVFESARGALSRVIAGCASGLEKASRGFDRDTVLASELDVSASAPLLEDGEFAR